MTADLLILDARTRPALTARPGATALAVRGNRIVALGPEAEALRGPATRVIDARGAWLLPGFVESHMHVFPGGATLRQVDLSAVHGREALAAALRAADAADPGTHMLTGFGLAYAVLGPRHPTRHDLDAMLPDRPVYLTAPDFHCAFANTAALRLAGVLRGADAGAGSEVAMGADGLATGELVEFGAMSLVKRHAPSGGREDFGLRGEEPAAPDAGARTHDLRTIRESLDYCARHGLTSVVSMDGNAWQAGLLRELAEADALPVRVSLPLTLGAQHGPQDVARAAGFGPGLTGEGLGRGNDMLRFGRIKMFMDGVIDTRTACLVAPYADAEGGNHGPLIPPDLFAAICTEADRRGMQITTHAVGDGAVRHVLDGYEAARRVNGPRDSRHRIEHIELIHPDDLPRFLDLGVTASMQPLHAPGTSGWPLEPGLTMIGRDRWPFAYAWRRILDAGVPLAFSTDWPVSPLPPLEAIHWNLARPAYGDAPDQRLTLDEALLAYTAAGARAEFAEPRRGRLAEGMQADLVLIEGELDDLAADIGATRVVTTICDGRVVFG